MTVHSVTGADWQKASPHETMPTQRRTKKTKRKLTALHTGGSKHCMLSTSSMRTSNSCSSSSPTASQYSPDEDEDGVRRESTECPSIPFHRTEVMLCLDVRKARGGDE